MKHTTKWEREASIKKSVNEVAMQFIEVLHADGYTYEALTLYANRCTNRDLSSIMLGTRRFSKSWIADLRRMLKTEEEFKAYETSFKRKIIEYFMLPTNSTMHHKILTMPYNDFIDYCLDGKYDAVKDDISFMDYIFDNIEKDLRQRCTELSGDISFKMETVNIYTKCIRVKASHKPIVVVLSFSTKSIDSMLTYECVGDLSVNQILIKFNIDYVYDSILSKKTTLFESKVINSRKISSIARQTVDSIVKAIHDLRFDENEIVEYPEQDNEEIGA